MYGTHQFLKLFYLLLARDAVWVVALQVPPLSVGRSAGRPVDYVCREQKTQKTRYVSTFWGDCPLFYLTRVDVVGAIDRYHRDGRDCKHGTLVLNKPS